MAGAKPTPDPASVVLWTWNIRLRYLSSPVLGTSTRFVRGLVTGSRRNPDEPAHSGKRRRRQRSISGILGVDLWRHVYFEAQRRGPDVAQRFLVVYNGPHCAKRYLRISGAAGFCWRAHHAFAVVADGRSFQSGPQRQQLPGAALRRALGAMAGIRRRQPRRQQRLDFLYGGQCAAWQL